MREPKYRVWHKKRKVMMLVRSLSWDEDGAFMWGWTGVADPEEETPEPLRPDQVELMEYTGIKDKTGKEIYESDVVKHIYDGIFLVEWSPGRFEFVRDRDERAAPDVRPVIQCANIVEVIGNVYANPELRAK